MRLFRVQHGVTLLRLKKKKPNNFFVPSGKFCVAYMSIAVKILDNEKGIGY